MLIQLATLPGRDDLANEDFAGAFAPGTPATVVVMARAATGRLDYLVLGDSAIVIDADGTIKTVTDRRIDDVAKAERLEMESLPTGTPQH